MEDPPGADENIARAVALMTEWTEWNESEDADTSFAVQLVTQDLVTAVTQDMLLGESITLITGLMSLARRLLIELEHTTKTPISTILQEAGQQAAE